MHAEINITDNDMNISRNIKSVATKHGKNISQLAKELGVAQSHLSRTINNERISLKDLEAIAQKIGCEVNDFFSVGMESSASTTITCPKCGSHISIKVEESL